MGKISVRSKIEYMIANSLTEKGVKFEYEPEDFLEHHIKPDFKIYPDNGEFYWELGPLERDWYKNRWYKKLNI